MRGGTVSTLCASPRYEKRKMAGPCAARAFDILRSPAGKPVLIMTDDGQKRYIESPAFRARSLRELGYAPGGIGGRMGVIPSSAAPCGSGTAPLPRLANGRRS